jgi:RNA polymerase sigma factor (sigma-70 family)
MPTQERESPVDMSETDLAHQVQLLKQGDTDAYNHIIQAHRSLAFIWAARFTKGRFRKREDIRSAAMLGLVQGVKWAADGRLHDDNITPYLVETIKRHIKDFLERDRIIAIERGAFKKLIQEHDIVDLPCSVFSISEWSYGKGRTNPPPFDDENDAPEDQSLASVATTDDIDHAERMRELIGRLNLTELENTVLELRLNNFSRRQIARRVGTVPQYITQVLQSIGDKFNRRKS